MKESKQNKRNRKEENEVDPVSPKHKKPKLSARKREESTSKKKTVVQPKDKKRKQSKPKSTERTQMNLLEFSDEVLLKIQFFLNYQSMCQCVESCTRLNQVYSDPPLWADMSVSRSKITKDGMAKLEAIPRFTKIKNIDLKGELENKNIKDVLQYACWRNENGDSLESLDLQETNLKNVSQKLLKEAICSIENVNIEETKLTTKQLDALFSFIPTQNILRRINLACINLAEVTTELLKKAVCHLQDVNLTMTKLTAIQLNALFSFIPTQDKLKRINIQDNNLEQLSTDLLKTAVCHLEDFNLTGSALTPKQLNALLSFIPTQNILRKINLAYNDLEKVSPELLKNAICHLEDVDLSSTHITTKQLNALFSFIPTQNILRKINLAYNDLVKVSPELLKKAICHLEDVNLRYTDITTKQLNALLSFIPSQRKLKRINLANIDSMYNINHNLLTKAVAHLRHILLFNPPRARAFLGAFLGARVPRILISSRGHKQMAISPEKERMKEWFKELQKK